MSIRKTPLREAQGVKLIPVEAVPLAGLRVRSTRARLTTLRPSQAGILPDARDALHALKPEVIASGSNRVVQRTIDWGNS